MSPDEREKQKQREQQEQERKRQQQQQHRGGEGTTKKEGDNPGFNRPKK